MNRVLKVPVLLHRAFSSSARRLRNKVPEAQKLFQVGKDVFVFEQEQKPSDVSLPQSHGLSSKRTLVFWFQEDNGLPVHIKGGTSDVLLYRATMTLTIAGKHTPADGQEPEFPKVLLPIMRGNQSSAGDSDGVSAGYPCVCPPNWDQPDLRWPS
uniref:Cytochrome c oxidase subunit 7A1, mitochondrial n=1 Tax=Oryzias latipes TaxID=8090 RepID=A0A3P9LIS4_ORYLA